jgi:hypothetical protein
VELAELRVLAQEPGLQLAAVQFEADAFGERLAQLALRPLDLDNAGLDVDLDALGDRDDFLADS